MKKMLITVNGKQYEVDVEIIEDDEEYYNPTGFQTNLPKHYPGSSLLNKEVSAPSRMPSPAQRSNNKTNNSGDSKSLTSPINGIILEIPVKEGQQVKENDVLFVLEAMKMKTNISSPFSGKIDSILVRISDTIEAGQEILKFE